MISDNSQSGKDGAGKVKPSTSCKGHRSSGVNWIPTSEKETYHTVVVNYRYAKMDKNYPRNTAAMSKKKHWSRMIAAMSAKRSNSNGECDEDDIPNLRKLYQCSHEEIDTESRVPGTPSPSRENINKALPEQPNTEFVKLEACCMPTLQKAIVEDALLQPLEENQIGSVCCLMPKPKTKPAKETEAEQEPRSEPEPELGQEIESDTESVQEPTLRPELEPEPQLLIVNELQPQLVINQEPEAEDESISMPKPLLVSVAETETELDDDIEFVNMSEMMPPLTPSVIYPKVIVLAENDEDDDSEEYCPRKKPKLDDTLQTCTRRNSTKCTQSPERATERKPSSLKSKVRIDDTYSEHNVKIHGHGKETSTDSGTQQPLKTRHSQNGMKQRQLELHRYRIAVEQKRLELLEVKLARERDEMLREQILFEKELELKSSQMKELIDDKQIDIL